MRSVPTMILTLLLLPMMCLADGASIPRRMDDDGT